MDDDLRRRLRRLGVFKGLQGLQKPAAAEPEAPTAAESVRDLPGEAVEGEAGTFWLDRRLYQRAHVHGRYALEELTGVTDDALGILGTPDLGPRPAFLDTETTGLAGGAGTLAFLVGVGVWDDDGLTLHLIFMRDPEEEPAALSYLDQVLSEATGLVTFNGRGFDVPILESRYILNRMPPLSLALPHLDLLPVARQLWRDHLPSRALGELERHILAIERSDEDLPSALIPDFYRQYLDTGDTSQIRRIFYHNEIDVLSLATLLAHQARMVLAPDEMTLAPAEWVGVGRLYDKAEMEPEAIEAWRLALSGELGELASDCAERIWSDLGWRYKRREAWDDAFEVWESWIRCLPLATEPLVEEAKYFEWTNRDLEKALDCTDRALRRALAHPPGMRRYKALAELRHRQRRLQEKLAREQEQGD
jgi:hypothetical protein